MKKKVFVVCANVLLLSMLFALTIGGTAFALSPEERTYHEETYILIPEIDEDKQELYTAESYFNPVSDEDGLVEYELSAWLLDQIAVKFAAVDGDVNDLMLTLGGAAEGAECLVLNLPADSQLSFPGQVGLIVELPNYGKVLIPAQTMDYDLSQLVFELNDSELLVHTLSGEAELYEVEVLFEALENSGYVMARPEPPEAETEAAEEE